MMKRRAKSILASAPFALAVTGATTAANAVAMATQVTTPSLFCGSSVPQQTLTVKPPINGQLIVTATGIVNYDHTPNFAYNWCLQLSQTAKDTSGCAASVYLNSTVSVAMNSLPTQTPASGGEGAFEPYSISTLIPVTAEKTYTFYVNGFVNFNGVCYLIQPTITAVLTPAKLPQ